MSDYIKPQRRSLRPQYNTVDGKFGSTPLPSHKPEKIDYVEKEKNKLIARLQSQFNPKIHKDKGKKAYAERMYMNIAWVDCLTNADRRLETRKDSDELVLRYCANRKTIPSQVPEKDIYEINYPFKSAWYEKGKAFGYGYYIQKFTESSGPRIIEQDIIANQYESCCENAQSVCDYRSEFMSYYHDEFTVHECKEQLEIESKQQEELLRQEKEKEYERLREKSWDDLELDLYNDTYTFSPPCSPYSPYSPTGQKNTDNNECIVIICNK